MISFSYVAKNEQNTVQTILAYGDQPCNPPSLIVRNICSSEGKPANLNTPFAVEWNGTEILPPCQGISSGPVLSRLLSERASDLRHEGTAFVVTSARGTAVGEFSRPGALRLLDGKRSFQYVLGQSAEVVRIGVARAANIRDLKGRNDRPAARGEHSAQRYGDRQRKHARRIHPVECPGHPPGTHERSGAEMSFQPKCRRAARGRHSLRRFHAPAVRQTALPLRVDAQRGAKLTTGSAQAYGRSIPSRRRRGRAEAQVDAEASRQRTSRLHPPGVVTRGTNRPASSPLP